MGFFDVIFGREPVRNNRSGIRPIPESNTIPADFDVITVDPDEPVKKVENRRPVIFENGLD